jgi:hypothetical protein
MAYITTTFSLNQLPAVGGKYQLYCTYITHDNHKINVATITDIKLIYGNVVIEQSNNVFYITPLTNNRFTLLCNATYTQDDVIHTLVGYYYGKAVYTTLPTNNYNSLASKFPKGVFKDLSQTSIIGAVIYATSKLVDDWYQKYQEMKQQLFSNQYNQDLEYELNSTKGLLSDSVYSTQVMRLLNSLSTYQLNTYDMELFVSQYIWYRLGVSSAVYIDDFTINPDKCWILGSQIQSILCEKIQETPPEYTGTTILQDENKLVKTKILWYIFNSSTFTEQFKKEIQQLIFNISRCDLENVVEFYTQETPPLVDYDYVGYTYKNDPRMLYGKCIQFTGQQNYPLNIVGYLKKSQE